MRIDYKGKLENVSELRIGVIGCGSHSFRNIFPVFQFIRARLIATCDFSFEKAQAYCEKFGGESYFSDYHEMLETVKLDAVLVIVGNDEHGRPMYPEIAVDCMEAGCDVWIEKPPAATAADIEKMMVSSKKTGRLAMVGYKKMYVQAYRKAKELADSEDFGGISMMTLQNPEIIPTVDELRSYLVDGVPDETAIQFLEHICHPLSQMISLLGAPESMIYDRNDTGAGFVSFQFPGGAMSILQFTCGMAMNGGVERTVIVSKSGASSTGRIGGRHIIVENNLVLTYHKNPDFSYGDETDFYKGLPGENTTLWQPEFSRGQMFNKGLFLLGYFGELDEFCNACFERRQPVDGTLEQAWVATHIFEKLLEGPGRRIPLDRPPNI